VRNRAPTCDSSAANFNYELLGRVLQSDFIVSYYGYPAEDNKTVADWLDSRITNEYMPEYDLKLKIIRNLRQYFDAASELAQEIGSKAYEDFAACQALIAARWGEVGSEAVVERPDDVMGSAELRRLKTLMKRARTRLWSDCKNYKPSTNPAFTRADGEALKAHVTAETEREIAAKAPKRMKKFGHEGNGLKGRKTKKMAEQLLAFEAFYKTVSKGTSTRQAAKNCWMKHKKNWDKAATASGEAKGYADFTKLLQAFTHRN